MNNDATGEGYLAIISTHFALQSFIGMVQYVLILSLITQLAYGINSLAKPGSAKSSGHQTLDTSNIPLSEYVALQDLYNTTNGKTWHWGPGTRWNFTGFNNPCVDKWAGIECTNELVNGSVHIQMLELAQYNLKGYIPSSIGDLKYLRNLTLSFNLLSGGGIPNEVGSLSHLQRLVIGSSRLVGTIPASLGQLTQLRTFDLSFNRFYSNIPVTLCGLYQLDGFYVNSNSLTGTIPACIDQFTHLNELYFDTNRLNGTLPASIGNLLQLTALSGSYNSFSGTIPGTYAALTQLNFLSLSNNQLKGTIPAFLSMFTQLYELDLNKNEFTGTVPNLAQLVNLELLHLSGNYLNGTIPADIALLDNLYDLNLGSNRFSGSISQDVCNFTNILYLSLTGNTLTGTLPPCLGNLTKLGELDFADNLLRGTLPESFASWASIAALVGSHNYFTGSIPDTLFALPSVNIIDFSDNLLTGELPNISIANGPSYLTYVNFAVNRLSGAIPASLSQFSDLIYLNFSSNQLTGTIPATLVQLNKLNFLYLNDNQLSGELPHGWENLHALSYLFLNGNNLRGTLPPSFADLSSLISLNVSSNYLTGTIPAAFSQLSSIQVLLLQNNGFTGTLHGLFNSSKFENLVTFQVSHNQLTGSLPEGLFTLGTLMVFAAVSNCFTGSIPLSLCNSTSINTLALDWLQSATSCHRALFPASLNGIVAQGLYSIGDPLTGGVPSCLFQMANLTTLHLSGNGLTGELPSDLTITPTLTDLSLSHNKLQGAIPPSMLNHAWTNLDLSYNRFTGDLQVNNSFVYATDSSIYLEQNRLSGKISRAFNDVNTISLLEGNLFACDTERDDIPQNDPYSDKYQCGSDTLDASVYAWLAVMFVLLIALLVVYYNYKQNVYSLLKSVALNLRLWWEVSATVGPFQELEPLLSNYRQICSAADVLGHVSVVSTAWILLVLLPVYIVCSQLYGTYAHQYAWTLSGAYTSGSTPFALQFVFLTGLVMLTFATFGRCLAMSQRCLTVDGDVSVPSVALEKALFWSSRAQRWCVQVLYVLLNFTVVLGVNVAYVVIALNENGNALTLAQFTLALFKVGFNSMCAPFMMRWLTHRGLGEGKRRDFVSVQLVVALINNILIPCFVVSVISPSCFYNIFEVADNVESTYQYNGKCVSFDQMARQVVTCKEQQVLTATTSYDPPFEYSYQCSSSFITYYAPAYVIMCILAGVAIPVVQGSLQVLHSRATPGTRWFALLDLVLPRILKPISTETTSAPQRNVFAPFFDAGQHLTTLLTYLGLLLTFGAVFPPLAICFLVTIGSTIAFTRLKVGRFVWLSREQTCVSYIRILNEECAGSGVRTKLRRAVLTVLVFSCVFYTLFLFDTLGDAVGFSRAYWVIIVAPLIPVCVIPLYAFSYLNDADTGKEEVARETDVEMMGVSTEELAKNPIHKL